MPNDSPFYIPAREKSPLPNQAHIYKNPQSIETRKIYQDRIGSIIGQTSKRAYDKVARMPTTIKKLMTQLNQL
jgi:hypothetical protein